MSATLTVLRQRLDVAAKAMSAMEAALSLASSPPRGCSAPLAYSLSAVVTADRELRVAQAAVSQVRVLLLQDVFEFPTD